MRKSGEPPGEPGRKHTPNTILVSGAKKVSRKPELRGTRGQDLANAVEIAGQLLQKSPDGSLDEVDLFLFLTGRYRKSLCKQGLKEYHRTHRNTILTISEAGLLTLKRAFGIATPEGIEP